MSVAVGLCRTYLFTSCFWSQLYAIAIRILLQGDDFIHMCTGQFYAKLTSVGF